MDSMVKELIALVQGSSDAVNQPKKEEKHGTNRPAAASEV